MTLFSDPNAIFLALGRIEKELPGLLGAENWQSVRKKLKQLKERWVQCSEPGEGRRLAAELVALIAPYDLARERLRQELKLMPEEKLKMTERGVHNHTPPELEVRYLNTFFTDPDTEVVIPPGRPLIFAQPYVLFVDVSPERRGLGENDVPFPSQALDKYWNQADMLPLTIVAGSKDFDIEAPCRPFQLPRSGPSEGVRFRVKPRLPAGKGFIQVELFYQGYLLQSKQVEASIVPTAETVLPDSLRPAQTAQVTFATTEVLDPEEVRLVPPRVLTVDVELDKRDQSINFRFLDRSRGDAELAFFDTVLSSEALGKAVKDIRQKLRRAFAGETVDGQMVFSGYQGQLSADGAAPAALLNYWLPQLANAGRSLYRALLPQNRGQAQTEDRGERLQAALTSGTVIQVNPVYGRVTIPWAMLYERTIKLVPGQTRVCELFPQAGPDCDCPHTQNPKVVCPFAFWGFRYAIEQLPCWVSAEIPKPPRPVRVIANTKPLFLNLNVYRGLNYWKDHINKLKQSGHIELLLAEEIAQLEDIWENSGSRLDVVYFYCHGGEFEGSPFLEISDGRIDSNFLEASELSFSHHPLIFLNGCSTGDYGPESYLSLIDDFRVAGASGIVGTECPVTEMFAEAYAGALFPRLFQGEPLGPAMLEVRLDLLKKNNPLGLVYSLYAPHEIALRTKVNVN